MPTPRILLSTFGACSVALLGVTVLAQTKAPNHITGEGLPSPAPKVTRNWGELPAGRTWGTSAGLDVDPKDGNIWGCERCGALTAGGRPVDCDNNLVDPVFKFHRHTGKVLASIGKDVMVTPHGIDVDKDGNVWIADFANNKGGTKGQQVHKVGPKGAKLMSLGIAGKPGNADGQFNQPNDVVVGPDGSIYVSDGHDAQGMTTQQAIAEGLKRGEFRTPHALMFDAKGRLWVADRGNHRLEIFDQDSKYLESRYMFGRISGSFIESNQLYAIDSESGPLNHPNWRDGVRIGPIDEDRVTAFVPPLEREDRVYQGTAGEGNVVDAHGNIYAAEGPNSLEQAGGAFTKYSVT